MFQMSEISCQEMLVKIGFKVMSIQANNDSFSTVPDGVDDAVGVEKANWYVAIVNNRSEKVTAEKLSNEGYEAYVASQEEYRLWRNGKKKKIDRVVIPSMVFLHCTENERRSVVTLPYIYRFLTNKAGNPNKFGRPVAIIPDRQMYQLKFMLGNSNSPVEFVDRMYTKGDKVRVIRGGLCGLEGEVITSQDGKSELWIRLDILGCAKVSIDPIDIEPINNNSTLHD